jgi:septal ring factor EnvC (AmiA/AmiB activator)
MGLKFHCLRWSCFFLLLFFIAGCSLKQGLKKPEGEEEFLRETTRLEKLAREHPEPSIRAKSHLQMAFLYVNHKNPRLNYARALQEMESYLSLSPAKAQNDNVENWLAVLREIEHLRKDRVETEKKNQELQVYIEKLQTSLGKVEKANVNLRDEVATLKETNNKMIETIEKLKSLDYQMEEKRNLIK